MIFPCQAVNVSLIACAEVYPYCLSAVMAGMVSEGSQFDARHYDSKMNEL